MRRLSRILRVVKWAAAVASLVLIGIAAISFLYLVRFNFGSTWALQLHAGGISVVPQGWDTCINAPPLPPPPLVESLRMDIFSVRREFRDSWIRLNNWPRFSGNVLIPVWLPLLATVALSSMLWIVDRRQVRSGFCSTCGYDLTGNVSGRCPECGTVTEKCAGSALTK